MNLGQWLGSGEKRSVFMEGGDIRNGKSRGSNQSETLTQKKMRPREREEGWKGRGEAEV